MHTSISHVCCLYLIIISVTNFSENVVYRVCCWLAQFSWEFMSCPPSVKMSCAVTDITLFACFFIFFWGGPSSIGGSFTSVGISSSVVTSLRHSFTVWYSPSWQFAVRYLTLFLGETGMYCQMNKPSSFISLAGSWRMCWEYNIPVCVDMWTISMMEGCTSDSLK